MSAHFIHGVVAGILLATLLVLLVATNTRDR